MNHWHKDVMSPIETPFLETFVRWEVILAEHGLTDRQKSIAKLMALGWSDKEIGQKLYMRTGTVRSHRREMFIRLPVRNRHHLLIFLLEKTRRLLK